MDLMKAMPPFHQLTIDLAVTIRTSSSLGCEIHLCGGVDITRWSALKGTGKHDSDCESEV